MYVKNLMHPDASQLLFNSTLLLCRTVAYNVTDYTGVNNEGIHCKPKGV